MRTIVKRKERVKAAIAVERSENRKLGGCAATYVSQGSCPLDCPFLGAGCYAETGHAGFTTRKLNDASAASPAALAEQEADAIDGLSGDMLLRLHVVGDARTPKAAEIVGAACRRYARRGVMIPRRGRKVWTYTHAWRTVSRESWGDAVSVLASVETVRDAKAAMAKGYAAAVVVMEFERDGAYTVDGTTVLPCPNQTRGVTCRECGLCRDEERLRRRGIVIAFQAHGSRKGAVALPVL